MAAPITIERFVQELEKLKREMESGSLDHGEYDQRLARVVSELRDRKLDADRVSLAAALDDVLRRGVTTPAVNDHLRARFGL